VNDIMAFNWRTKLKASLRLVLIGLVIELWVLTFCSIIIIVSALFLYSHRLVDSIMAAGVLVSLISVGHWRQSRISSADCLAVLFIARLCLLKLSAVETIPLSWSETSS
jgi:hypothetical protein